MFNLINNNYNLALLTCYYGEFPWYFKFFLKTCEYNPTVDFIIITDIDYDGKTPTNVKFIYKTLDDIIRLASEKLGFKVSIDWGYKLCDFKPAYGVIFSDLLQEYEFWGHGDIDIIYGNIREFITDDILDRYDIINVRHDYLTGYFLLYKNEEKINYIFKESKDYKKVFTTPKSFYFDETCFKFEEFKRGIHYSQIKSEIESMNHVILKLKEKGQIKVYFDFHVIEGTPGKLVWDKGELIYNNKFESMLYHMVVFKALCVPSKMKDVPTRFRISPTRIYV